MMPKGRLTVRKGASALKGGPTLRLWDIEAPAGSTLAKLERSYLTALDQIDQLEAHRAAAATSGQFTEAGLLEDAKRFAVSKLAPVLHRGRQAVAQAKREAEEQRAKLKLQPLDKSDVVGEMRRAEARSWLRSLPEKDRRNYIARNVDSLDPELALAIVTDMGELSGVLKADRKVLADKALRAQHGDAIDKVLELERGIGIAEHAIEAVRGEIARDVGVPDPHTFNQLAAPHEKAATVPYLKKFTEDGVEVIRVMNWTSKNGGTWRKATPEEVARR